MPRQRKPSTQAVQLLRALLTNPPEWRYGYDLTREVGLKSGTLYPLLMRLSDEGLLESEWHPAARTGLPPRHGYRLTQRGIAFAAETTAETERRTGSRGLASA